MTNDLINAQRLDEALDTPLLAVIGDPEFAALSMLASEISSAFGGRWTSAADRTRMWHTTHRHGVRERRVAAIGQRMLSHKTSLIAGSAAITLGAAVGWAIVHRHRHPSAA